jgi:hypothetical protein
MRVRLDLVDLQELTVTLGSPVSTVRCPGFRGAAASRNGRVSVATVR